MQSSMPTGSGAAVRLAAWGQSPPFGGCRERQACSYKRNDRNASPGLSALGRLRTLARPLLRQLRCLHSDVKKAGGRLCSRGHVPDVQIGLLTHQLTEFPETIVPGVERGMLHYQQPANRRECCPAVVTGHVQYRESLSICSSPVSVPAGTNVAGEVRGAPVPVGPFHARTAVPAQFTEHIGETCRAGIVGVDENREPGGRRIRSSLPQRIALPARLIASPSQPHSAGPMLS